MENELFFFIKWYLSVGCVIYLIFLLKDAVRGFSSFSKAKSEEILRGVFGIPLWPYVLWMMDGIESSAEASESDELRERLASEVANSSKSIDDIQCPPHIRNPGLYFGYIRGWNGLKEVQKKKDQK